jgi:hypothetical protein
MGDTHSSSACRVGSVRLIVSAPQECFWGGNSLPRPEEHTATGAAEKSWLAVSRWLVSSNRRSEAWTEEAS